MGEIKPTVLLIYAALVFQLTIVTYLDVKISLVFLFCRGGFNGLIGTTNKIVLGVFPGFFNGYLNLAFSALYCRGYVKNFFLLHFLIRFRSSVSAVRVYFLQIRGLFLDRSNPFIEKGRVLHVTGSRCYIIDQLDIIFGMGCFSNIISVTFRLLTSFFTVSSIPVVGRLQAIAFQQIRWSGSDLFFLYHNKMLLENPLEYLPLVGIVVFTLKPVV